MSNNIANVTHIAGGVSTDGPHAVRHQPQLAINPIAYWLVDGKVDRSRAVLEVAFKDFQTLGYTAVKADVPADMTESEYLEWIGAFGLAPSISLFSSPLDETIDLDPEIERAKAFARQQRTLGLDRAMVSSMMIPARMQTPGIGADFQEDRFERCLDALGQVCEAFQDEGVFAVLHNHIGGVFETEAEITRALGSIDASLLGFGPDTGHLAWAGADPASVIAQHRSRIGAIHLKDAFADFLDPAKRVEMNYRQTQATMRLWAEPGFGVIDFEAVLASMPADYDGDFMIEVDVPSIEDRFESARRCYEWAVRSLPISPL